MNRRPLYRLTRGSWQPARLVQVDVLLACYAAVVQAFFRSWDYTTGVEAHGGAPASLSLVERAFPLWVWLAAFAIGAMTLLYGVRSRRHLVVWAGHFWLFGCYLVLGVGILLPALGHPYLDGVRNATVLILPCTFHWLLLHRTGPKPTRITHVVEQVGGPQ